MKKIILPLCGLIAISFAQTTKTIPKGWSLNGIGISENSLDPSTLQNGVNSVWKYSDGSWKAYSSNIEINNTLSNAGISKLTSIDQGEGFWINAEKETSFSSSTLSKFIPDSFETSEDDNYNDYTYNYTVEGGLIQSDKIAWEKAVSYNNAADFNETTLSKAIPKAFYSLNKKIILVIYSINCSGDVTIALTPYSSINSIPGASNILKQNALTSVTSTDNNYTTNDSNINATLTSYSSGKTIEVVKEFSADISVENSTGTKISPSDIDSLCSDLDGYMIFDDKAYDENASYKFHYINGYNDINSTDINLTKLTSKVKLPESAIPNLKPFFITKTTNESLSKKSNLNVNIKGSLVGSSASSLSLFSSKLDVDSLSLSGTTSTSSFPSISTLNDTYDIVYGLQITKNSTALKHYITPSSINDHYLYGYNPSTSVWQKLDQDTTGDYSHFIVAKDKSSSGGSSNCQGAIELDNYNCGDTITIEKGELGYFNVINYQTDYSVSNQNNDTTKVKKSQTQYTNEVEIIAYREGTETITVTDSQNNTSTFNVIVTATKTTTNINGVTWINEQPDGYYNYDTAKEYCKNLGYRLPTGAELENAWNYYGAIVSPPYFEQNTFYWGQDSNGTYRTCAMDAYCNTAGTWEDTSGTFIGNGHPRCVQE